MLYTRFIPLPLHFHGCYQSCKPYAVPQDAYSVSACGNRVWYNISRVKLVTQECHYVNNMPHCLIAAEKFVSLQFYSFISNIQYIEVSLLIQSNVTALTKLCITKNLQSKLTEFLEMDVGKDSSGFHCMRVAHSNNSMTYEAIQISEI